MIRIPPVQLGTLVLASLFIAQALLRMVHAEFNILRFAVLGWPPWAVWGVSAAEIAGALLLLHPRAFPAGALILASVAGAFIWAYTSAGAPQAGSGQAGLVLALVALAFLRRRRTGG